MSTFHHSSKSITRVMAVTLALLLSGALAAAEPVFIGAGAPFSNTQAMIVHSDDGKNWNTVYNKKHSIFIRLVSGQNNYVALTQKFGVLHSDDGLQWQEANLPSVIGKSSLSPGGLAYGDGLFVVAGSSQIILYSSDGKNWQKWGETLESTQQKGQAVAAAERRKNNELNVLKKAGADKVAIDNAKRGSTIKADLLSTDDSTASGRIHFNAVEFVNGEFFLLGNGDRITRMRANNGQLEFVHTYKSGSDLVPTTRGAAFGNNVYVVAGTQSLYVSADATQWQSVSLGAQAWSITFGNGLFVIVNGFGEAFSSKDGKQWQKKNLGCTRVYRQVIFTGDHFVAVGDNCVARSKDGNSWMIDKMQFDQKHMAPSLWTIVSGKSGSAM